MNSSPVSLSSDHTSPSVFRARPVCATAHLRPCVHPPCQRDGARTWQDAPALRLGALALVAAALGCSPSSPATGTLPRGPRAVTTSASTVTSPPSTEAPPARSTAAALPFDFSRVEAASVTSLAVGKPPKVAVLAQGEALVFDGNELH